ncbi:MULTISPECIES: hypothetical protein [Arthrobacter]|uniref:Uncharacterized protein n=1 Tax=Arthrobacter caoxuetaonis TaxID=2886935 RepID=A0A9X1MEX5_9MICC|nr:MULTISPECIES: hypothetical protein [Arthrobacter]MCC3282811.1 hypothetical protein [Arthrobacter caoxuetaonis]MCC3297945.1 hypothetical protein [Arthrobacter caoxuetaonis]MCC9192261.1 hypothetical protein [Arthrobacter sp. zg-Y916]USQ56960.1 hypothetical protein NF551_14690 [Arthrobacter caoxuetaonis]
MPSATPSPSTPNTFARRIRNVSSIHRGDHVEVRSGGHVYYRGEVRDTAPGLATLWLRDEESGAHTAVSTEDYTIWRTLA